MESNTVNSKKSAFNGNNLARKILITGSNGGIGHSIVLFLLENGYRNLACHYRSDSSNLSKILSQFDLDPERHLFKANLENETEVQDMRGRIEKSLGNIECLVNVAGASTNSMSWKLSLVDFQKIINSNLTSAFLCSREFIPKMREHSFGRIINFSSIVGFTGVPGASHYCAAKAGLVGFTKSISLELATKNITANCIALGYFDQGLIRDVPSTMIEDIKNKIAVKRLGTARDVGAAVQYLISDDSSFYTGQVLHLNGGQY